jgi:cytochrome c peroxidase
VAKDDDIGRGRLFPTSVKLQHAFKTPTLRDLARRAPYMHDGSISSLAEVIDLYNRGGIDRPSRDNDIRPLNLQSGEKSDLIAFLNTSAARLSRTCFRACHAKVLHLRARSNVGSRYRTIGKARLASANPPISKKPAPISSARI